MSGNIIGGSRHFKKEYEALANGRPAPMGATARDRAKGALVGLVVGDCLGSPVEFTEIDGHQWIDQMVPCPHWGLPAGYWTDDSALAFNIMQAYLDDPKDFAVMDVANAFVDWYERGRWSSTDYAFGIGRDCGAGIENYMRKGTLKNGTEDSQGNGTVMRFAPSWFIARKMHPSAMDARLRVMGDISDFTHNSRRTRGEVDRLAAILDAHVDGATRTAEPTIYTSRRFVNNSGWCVSTVQAALWAFHGTCNFRDALVAAVNLGGDADTIGAVCGQIAGSFYGFSAIPKEWYTKVKDWKKVEKFIDRFLDATGFGAKAKPKKDKPAAKKAAAKPAPVKGRTKSKAKKPAAKA